MRNVVKCRGALVAKLQGADYFISSWHRGSVFSYKAGVVSELEIELGTQPLFGLVYHLPSLQPVSGKTARDYISIYPAKMQEGQRDFVSLCLVCGNFAD